MESEPRRSAGLAHSVRAVLGDRVMSRLHQIPPIQWVGLVVCLVPIVAAAVRAFRASWRPVYDSAYIGLRTFDVFGDGFGAVSDESIRMVGPLQAMLFSPFTRIHPYVGLAIGVALVNALCVTATWCAARRMFGTRGVIAVMVATAVLEMSFGAPTFIDARQQHALLLPFWALLWLTADASGGNRRAILPWLVVGSLVLQSDFNFVYVVAAAGVAVIGGYLWNNRRHVGTRAFAVRAGVTLVALAVLWSPTIWDQLFGAGSFGRAVREIRGQSATGWSSGAQIVADSSFGYPFWWPGSVRDFHEPWSFGPTLAMGFVAAWLIVLFEVASNARRRMDTVAVRLAVLALVFVVAALAWAARMPRGSFDLLPQSYLWFWPVSLFAAVAIARACAHLLPPTHNVAEALAVAATVIAALTLPDRYVFPPWQIAPEINAAGGRSMLADIGDSLDGIDFDLGSAIVVDDVAFRLLAPDYYNILGELTQRGLDVHFPPGSAELERFGAGSCENGTERWRLKIQLGHQRPTLDPLDVVLAEVDGPAGAPHLAEMSALNQRMLGLIASGEIEIDRDRMVSEGLAGDMMLGVLDRPDEPHGDLWFSLFALVGAGAVDIPPQYRADFARWSDLEQADVASNVLVFLRPNYFAVDECPG